MIQPSHLTAASDSAQKEDPIKSTEGSLDGRSVTAESELEIAAKVGCICTPNGCWGCGCCVCF